MRLRRAAVLLLAGVVMSAPAVADEVTEQIGKALTAYQNHNSEAALTALDAAAGKLRQERADQLKTLLPPPPADWTADPVETSAISASMLGGGTSASRTYHSGDQQVQVDLTTDSPMLQQMAALVDSPLGQSPGVKTEKVDDRDVAYTIRDNSLLCLIGKTVTKITGNKQTPEATLLTFMGAINFAALEKLAE